MQANGTLALFVLAAKLLDLYCSPAKVISRVRELLLGSEENLLLLLDGRSFRLLAHFVALHNLPPAVPCPFALATNPASSICPARFSFWNTAPKARASWGTRPSRWQ